MQRIFLALGLLAGVIAGACVDIPDENHCWHRERDATCVEIYEPGVVCSPCLRGHNGCVDAELAPDCEHDDEDGESSSSSSEGG